MGLAFGGATENLQDVINVVFDVVQKQQVVIASTRAELDRQRAEHELLKQRFSDEMGAMRGELQAVSKGEPLEETKPYSVVVGSLPPDHSNECMQKLLDEHEAETGEEHAVAEVDDPIHEKKWAAAHQVLHFDTAAAALRAAAAVSKCKTWCAAAHFFSWIGSSISLTACSSPVSASWSSRSFCIHSLL